MDCPICDKKDVSPMEHETAIFWAGYKKALGKIDELNLNLGDEFITIKKTEFEKLKD